MRLTAKLLMVLVSCFIKRGVLLEALNHFIWCNMENQKNTRCYGLYGLNLRLLVCKLFFFIQLNLADTGRILNFIDWVDYMHHSNLLWGNERYGGLAWICSILEPFIIVYLTESRFDSKIHSLNAYSMQTIWWLQVATLSLVGFT